MQTEEENAEGEGGHGGELFYHKDTENTEFRNKIGIKKLKRTFRIPF
jgi:hypothetical protein